MQYSSAERFKHQHDFTLDTRREERRTWIVIGLTFITMVVEIVAGFAYGSMALLADGWHMSTHVAALSITVFAYKYARWHQRDTRFTFGTGKVSVLGGFASAAALAVIGLVVALESLERIITPVHIQFNQAIIVAIVGLVVNIASAFILGFKTHQHQHDQVGQENQHHDFNMKAAYLHVVADALTSLFAIVALMAGKYFGWVLMDPVMGIVGAILITRWSYILIKNTGKVLLDRTEDDEKMNRIKEILQTEPDTLVTDLHLWQLGQGHFGVIISIATEHPRSPDHYKNMLQEMKDLSHITVEINPIQQTDKDITLEKRVSL